MKDIPGYEGLYAATESGDIWSYRKKLFLKPYVSTGGYLKVNLFDRDGRASHKYVHRLVASSYLEVPEGANEVNHKDFDRANNSAANLEWCTHVENAKHTLKHGRWRRHLSVKAKNLQTGEQRTYKYLKHAAIDLFGFGYSLAYYHQRYGTRFTRGSWLIEVAG